ncbi:MAG: hypothetical protein M3033_06005 [Acidobacteriota bacterium]|nr:hypothetical protein [Acidobacteriota bacterium]
MKKFVLLLLLLLLLSVLAISCDAQETCSLGLTDSPAFFNLKLGMTPAQVKSVFGKTLKLKVKREGTFFQNFITKPPPIFLPNVRALYLRFFDGKLYQIEVFYEAKNEKQTLEEFVNVLSANLNLPQRFWENENGKFKLNCNGFSLVADNVLNPRTELTDEAARLRFEESQKPKNKKKIDKFFLNINLQNYFSLIVT